MSTTPPSLRIADPVADRRVLIELNLEYMDWVFGEIERAFAVSAQAVLGMTVADYVPTVIDKVCGDAPPRGVFYLAQDGGRTLAMGGLRHSADGVAEIKRVYVRRSGRGRGLGEALARRLLADARAFGYRAVRLDTLPFMDAAQALYESLGFVDCAPYPVEMPPALRARLRFMQCTLAP